MLLQLQHWKWFILDLSRQGKFTFVQKSSKKDPQKRGGVKILLPYVANMSYFWDTFGPVHKIPENSAPVLVGEAGASVHARILR